MSERYGEDCFIPVDDISGDEEWNFQPGLLHGDLLYEVDVLELPDIQKGADASIGDVLDEVW